MTKSLIAVGGLLGVLGGLSEWTTTVGREFPAGNSNSALDWVLYAPLLVGPIVLLTALVLRYRPGGRPRAAIGRTLLLLAGAALPVLLGAAIAAVLLRVAPSDACRDLCGLTTDLLAVACAAWVVVLGGVGLLLELPDLRERLRSTTPA
jgi:hypothetical protein